jgi:hypothetical protein
LLERVANQALLMGDPRPSSNSGLIFEAGDRRRRA